MPDALLTRHELLTIFASTRASIPLYGEASMLALEGEDHDERYVILPDC